MRLICQFCISASASVSAFDSPATTDAALAALAAEAGLIPPSSDDEGNVIDSGVSSVTSGQDTADEGKSPDKIADQLLNITSDEATDNFEIKTEQDESVAVSLAESTSTTSNVVGLFGGSKCYKLGLKGGGKYTASTSGPNRPFMWRKGT